MADSNKPKVLKVKKPVRRYRKKKIKSVLSVKHRAVLANIRKMQEAGERINIGKAMRQAGYSESSADSVSIKRTKSWNAILDDMFPDDKILKAMKEGSKATHVIYASSDGKITDTKKIPDYTNRFRFLDAVLKLKKRYEEQHNVKFAGLSKEEIIQFILDRVTGDSGGSSKT